MVLSLSQVLFMLGIMFAAGWVVISLAASMVSVLAYLLCQEVRDDLRKKIISCVVEGKCPAADSQIHIVVERIMWFFIVRGSLIRRAFGVGVCIFFQGLLFPLSKAEIAIRKIV